MWKRAIWWSSSCHLLTALIQKEKNKSVNRKEMTKKQGCASRCSAINYQRQRNESSEVMWWICCSSLQKRGYIRILVPTYLGCFLRLLEREGSLAMPFHPSPSFSSRVDVTRWVPWIDIGTRKEVIISSYRILPFQHSTNRVSCQQRGGCCREIHVFLIASCLT